ncbi:3-deoxy-D-manno-octulosonic acid kinase [Marinobacter vulgaris]|uniref:3-deoxy-D-manno-octulosonic acid kinase n=1 Tax=Marinobacter vulgaris TaxID=1928331 RepID=UPI001D0D9C2B|nr:3-deoxy-D-manno-octulosonic acid kinase [Marinobacter vulgaris]
MVTPGCADRITPEWCCPAYWGNDARPVDAGGRGGAWFAATPVGELVLRQYLRGGLMSKISRSNYLFTGYDRSRSFCEFRLLEKMIDFGLPVPQPVAAVARRHHWLFYEAAILIRRIQGARPLPEVKPLESSSLWREIGRVIRRFHDSGLNHADLNCDNILIASGQVYLIDFDKCRLLETAAPDAPWKRDNLSRLWRSVQKRCHNLSDRVREELWSALLEGYQGA